MFMSNPGAFLDHRQTDPPRADDRDGLARDLVAEKRQETDATMATSVRERAIRSAAFCAPTFPS